MPGPAPNPNARRNRGKASGWVSLPADGRKGKSPAWPLEGRAPAGWSKLWRCPQSVEWERLQLQETVANYLLTRNSARAALLAGEPSAALLGELRQQEDRLGLSAMSMARLKWDIAEPKGRKRSEVQSGERWARLVAL